MIFTLILASPIFSHANMLSPAPRGNTIHSGYCSRGRDNCKTACDAPKSESSFNSKYVQKKVVKRGEKMEVSWYRHSHPGGFVRLAIVPFDQSDDLNAFNNNVIKYSCFEVKCKEDRFEPVLGKDNGPGWGKCYTDVTIPTNLPDGPITLQWTWVGGGIYYAQKDTTFANYVSCSDMLIQGGPKTATKPKPFFVGGDATNPDWKQCKYWGPGNIDGCIEGSELNPNNQCGKTGSRNGVIKL